jgi:S1-C subfamily serine protease
LRLEAKEALMKKIVFTLILLLCLNLYAQQAYLGIYVENMTAQELRSIGLSNGIRVDLVMPGSPADVYGIKDNDVIYKMNNTVIKQESDLTRFLSGCLPEGVINVHLRQDNHLVVKQVHLTKRDNLYKDLYIFNYIQNPWLFVGMNVEPISASLAKLLNLEAGMVILEVRENSIASVQGLEAGDIIISVNENPTHSEKTLTDALNRGLQNQPMRFHLWRDSKRIVQTIDLTNSLKNDKGNSNEVFIVGPDIFDNELYSYSREKINRLLKKSKTELESDIERLEQEVFKLKQKVNGN